ncbi:phosphoglycerate kinase [Acetobacter sp. CAG:977]|nr:phosphoglycerate kinase [Acetobacter sp. CAG:977]
MSKFNTLDDLQPAGKVVFVRADLNVPVKDGKITDTTRIDRLVPTLKELVKKGAKVVVGSHFGRPKGQRNPEMSLKQIQGALSSALGQPVEFVDDCIGPKVADAVAKMKDGDVVLLENLRFYAEEEKNDPAFAAKLAENVDIYVDDAFSCAHRAHASTEGMAKLKPNAAGRLMQAELEALDAALGNPVRPVAAIVGGAKVSTKLDLLGNLVSKVDVLVIGGGMANTFLYAQGVNVGNSLCEKEMADTAREILEKAKAAHCEIVLPTDVVVAKEFAENPASLRTTDVNDVKADEMILDIGPKSAEEVIKKLEGCKTVIWNGPVGAFETKPFNKATDTIAEAVGKLTVAGKLLSVGGGGDTVSALKKAGVADKMSYLSAAGGAFLEWMEGKVLPGVKVLEK